MKKRTALISIVLSLVLVLGAFQAAFAGYGIKGTAPDGNEYNIEKAALKAFDDAKTGKYELMGTDELAGLIDAGYLIIDTMPDTSYNGHHVPGAINIECGDNTSTNGDWDEEDQGGALLAAAKSYSGTKSVKYYWNTKTKKWSTTKSKKYYGKCTKKSDKYYGKKVKTVKKDIKNKPIVVYCGFVKCRRSHFAADYLVRKGYTKVYRYIGGISAWGDADPELPYEAVETPAEPVEP